MLMPGGDVVVHVALRWLRGAPGKPQPSSMPTSYSIEDTFLCRTTDIVSVSVTIMCRHVIDWELRACSGPVEGRNGHM